MVNLTREELNEAKSEYIKYLELPTTISDVRFYRTSTGCLAFRYKNATGLIFPDNGFLGSNEDGKDYYLLWRLSCSYSNECKYNPTFYPNLLDAANAVKKSWDSFTNEGNLRRTLLGAEGERSVQ